MRSWNQRNGQRATVKRPGTKEYHKDFLNQNKQFFDKKTLPACLSCGSTSVVAKGGNGCMFIYCAKCGKQLKVVNTKPIKVGNWSKTEIYRARAGLCITCGNNRFTGKMHLDSSHKHFVSTMTCTCCGARVGWHGLD